MAIRLDFNLFVMAMVLVMTERVNCVNYAWVARSTPLLTPLIYLLALYSMTVSLSLIMDYEVRG